MIFCFHEIFSTTHVFYIASRCFQKLCTDNTCYLCLIRALIKDGWTITHDPYVLKMKPGQSIDLGAEKIIIAERGTVKIALEIKSFLTSSKLYKFYEALGQFMSYRIGLRNQEPERILYLAMPEKVYKQLMEYTTVPETVEEANLKIVTIDLVNENIVKWID